LGLSHLPGTLFDEVLVPPQVAAELRRSLATQSPIDIASIRGARVVQPRDSSAVIKLGTILDAGEAEAICLAMEHPSAALLIDELDGRAYAKANGLEVVGAVGLLVRGKKNGLVNNITPLLDRLQTELRFFISPALRSEALQQAGELER
jgi:predicted nucleic acid-binding protein